VTTQETHFPTTSAHVHQEAVAAPIFLRSFCRKLVVFSSNLCPFSKIKSALPKTPAFCNRPLVALRQNKKKMLLSCLVAKFKSFFSDPWRSSRILPYRFFFGGASCTTALEAHSGGAVRAINSWPTTPDVSVPSAVHNLGMLGGRSTRAVTSKKA